MCQSSVTIKIFCTEHLNIAKTLSKIIRIIIVIVRVKCLRRIVATRFGCFFFSVRLSRFARMSNKSWKSRKIPKMNRRFGWNTNSGLELEIGKVSCKILFQAKKKRKIFENNLPFTFSELIVTNISVREYTNVPKTARNWQFLEVNGTNYLFRNEKSTLFCNKLDLDKGTIVEFTRLIVKGTILKFKAIEMKSNIVIVLCVQLNTGILLECHALLDGNSFQYLGSLPVLKHVKDIEIITKLSDNEEPYKIFVLNEEEFFLQLQNSIDIYGFDIDFSTNALNFW